MDAPYAGRRPRSCLPLSAALATAFLIAACGDEAGDAAADGAAIPEGAFAVGDDVYMVPAGEDETGCPQFTMFSPTKAVVMVIHYRGGDGGFTPDRSKADCPPAGEDRE